jgi:hypothetical protein
MIRFLLLLIGFGLAVIDGVSLIAYLNIITTGHGISGYLLFIKSKAELYLFLIGNVLIWLSIYFPFQKRNE